jgi:hypothetical protein
MFFSILNTKIIAFSVLMNKSASLGQKEAVNAKLFEVISINLNAVLGVHHYRNVKLSHIDLLSSATSGGDTDKRISPPLCLTLSHNEMVYCNRFFPFCQGFYQKHFKKLHFFKSGIDHRVSKRADIPQYDRALIRPLPRIADNSKILDGKCKAPQTIFTL